MENNHQSQFVLIHQFFAEMLGTCLVILIGGSCFMISYINPQISMSQLEIALAYGLSVLLIGGGIFQISGCHLNPIVSLGMYFSGLLKFKQLPSYITGQLLGSIVATSFLYFIVDGQIEPFLRGTDEAIMMIKERLVFLSPPMHFILETILNATLVFTIVSSHTNINRRYLVPFIYGASMLLVQLISLQVFMFPMNPIESLALTLFDPHWNWQQIIHIWLAPFVGVGVGVFVYHLFNHVQLVESITAHEILLNSPNAPKMQVSRPLNQSSIKISPLESRYPQNPRKKRPSRQAKRVEKETFFFEDTPIKN